MKSIPKTEQILNSRTEEERVAIALEYLASFIIWTERLTPLELTSLNFKIKDLIHPSNTQNLNKALEDISRYLLKETDLEDL
jgi:hypothetical protein